MLPSSLIQDFIDFLGNACVEVECAAEAITKRGLLKLMEKAATLRGADLEGLFRRHVIVGTGGDSRNKCRRKLGDGAAGDWIAKKP